MYSIAIVIFLIVITILKKKIKIRKDHSQISVENGVGVYPSLKISEIFYGNVNGSRFHKHSRGG